MHRLVVASILLLAASRPHASHGQLGGAEPPSQPQQHIHDAYVILDGENDSSSNVLNVLARTLNPSLPSWPKDTNSRVSVGQASLVETKLNGAQIFNLAVYVESNAIQPTEAEMRQLWEIARKQLEAELNRVTDDVAKVQRRRLDKEIQRLVATQPMESDVTELIEQLAERQAESAGSEGNFSQGLAEAFSKQRELKLRDAGVRARREAIEHRIDEVRKVADESAAKDPMLAELEKLVEIRRKQLDAVRAVHAVGREGGSEFQLAEAEGELASAIVELARATTEASERAGGGMLREMNNELSNLLVEAAEVEGQRKELGQIIAEIRKDVGNMARAMGEAENLKARIQTLRSRLAEEDARINDLRREYEQLAPQSVTLRPLTVDKSEPPEPEASAPGAPE